MLSAAKHLARWAEMLRGVDTERSECAQHDSVVDLPAVLWLGDHPRNLHHLFEGAQNRGMLAEREPIQYKHTMRSSLPCRD